MLIDDSKLDQIEDLLCQSMAGTHILFENETLARILKKPTEELDFFRMENLDKIQDLFLEFIKIGSFTEKQDFLRSLDPESFEILVRTYFHIVDNTIYSSCDVRH